MEGKFQPDKLIENVVYPMRPWIYCLFKLGNIELSGKEATQILFSFQLECVWKRHLVFCKKDGD